jgi:hypothetical protein
VTDLSPLPPEDRLPARRPQPRWKWAAIFAAAVVLVVGVPVTIGAVNSSAHGSSAPTPAAAATSETPAADPTTATESPTPTPTSTPEPIGPVTAATVDFDCRDSDSNDVGSVEVDIPGDGLADFSQVWFLRPSTCDVTRSGDPYTTLELAAFDHSKDDKSDLVLLASVLYEMCAEAGPDDVFASPGFVMGEGQIPEAQAALMLCPKQPHAAKWRGAITRGLAEIKLEKNGQLFGDGVFLVGKEIKPGRYFTTDVSGCYWERQNRSGGIIDNNFVSAARRVEVTIRSSDYAFHSDGCGTWRPA